MAKRGAEEELTQREQEGHVWKRWEHESARGVDARAVGSSGGWMTYDSIAAAARELKVSSSCITDCVADKSTDCGCDCDEGDCEEAGHGKHAGGYEFRQGGGSIYGLESADACREWTKKRNEARATAKGGKGKGKGKEERSTVDSHWNFEGKIERV